VFLPFSCFLRPHTVRISRLIQIVVIVVIGQPEAATDEPVAEDAEAD
jgi:hypothetical protein